MVGRGGAMQATRRPSRWRSGAKAALYLFAFGIVAAGTLIAAGFLFLMFIGVFLGGGLLALLGGVALLWYFGREETRERTAR